MSRSNLSKLKVNAVQMIAYKAKLERRINKLQEELVSTIQGLDKLVKFIAQQEEKVTSGIKA